MAEKETKQEVSTEEQETKKTRKSNRITQFRCMADSYLDGVFYQRGHIYGISAEFASAFPDIFKPLDLKTPNSAAVFDPTGDAIREAEIEKYTKNIFPGVQDVPVMGKMEG